jgi:hypothetical protein
MRSGYGKSVAPTLFRSPARALRPWRGAQVSVRKAGVAAAARLLRALPGEPGLAALWVRAALPAVRDAEASLQELLLDQAGALLNASDMRVLRRKTGMLQPGAEAFMSGTEAFIARHPTYSHAYDPDHGS